MNMNNYPLPFINPDLKNDILSSSTVTDIKKGEQILKADQFVQVIPIVLEGLVKVFSRFENRDLLLYYIAPEQSCIMSFSAALTNKPSRVYAITEEDSKLLLVPVDLIPGLLKKYPDFNQVFFSQYDLRYSELLETIKQLLENKMDQRLMDYLRNKSALIQNEPVKLSHSVIATELGTAREVVSRVLKKLEVEGEISQSKDGIRII